MGTRRRLLIIRPAAALLATALATVAVAQPVDLLGATPVELPAPVLAELATIEDYAYNFDHPGYYALLEHIAMTPPAADLRERALPIGDWTLLAERPSEYRGQPLTLRGEVWANKAPYIHIGRPELGRVAQLELVSPGAPVKATIICTTDVSDIPLLASVRVTGYFVMMRRYRDAQNREQIAALLVSHGPTVVERLAPPAQRDPPRWIWITAAVVGGLLFGWLLLRRATPSHGRPDYSRLHANHAAPQDLSADLSDWAEHQPAPADDDAGQGPAERP